MSKPGGAPSSGRSVGDVLRRRERHPACRRREARPGFRMERENLFSDAKGQATSGSNREGERTEAGRRDGAARSSDERSVMELERGGCVVQKATGQLKRSGNGRNPWTKQSRSRFPNGKSGKPSNV